MSDQKNFLYKYRSIDRNNIKWTQKIFTHNELYFARSDQFNDPFDCKFNLSFEASVTDTKKYLKRILEKNHPDLSRQQKRQWVRRHFKDFANRQSEIVDGSKKFSTNLLSTLGIFSLSRVPDNILMWSHYANDHKGFCLIFLDDPTDRFIARAQEVKYSETYPIVNPIVDDEKERLEKSLLTKSAQWAYEQEMRIIDHTGGPGTKVFPPHLLEGVIFGCRMSEEHERLIREWCKDREPMPTFYKAKEASQGYSLELIEV